MKSEFAISTKRGKENAPPYTDWDFCLTQTAEKISEGKMHAVI